MYGYQDKMRHGSRVRQKAGAPEAELCGGGTARLARGGRCDSTHVARGRLERDLNIQPRGSGQCLGGGRRGFKTLEVFREIKSG